ncbi:MAG: WYL domain-containing protein [Pseudomonadota bacterium]
MRASRLLSLLMLLQGRGRLSAQALAAELEVSVRTVYRDVDELSASGVPVWAERGRQGGFVLQPGWRTRVDGLTAPEAQAMFLGGLPGPAAELGLGEAMASAQLKLLAALPDGWREDARRVSSRFHADPIDWYRGPAETDHLPAIAQAVWGERRIDVRYESWRGTSRRRLDPLGLVLKAGVWYVVASHGKGPRTWRLSNILELVVGEERFVRPAGFDLAAYWAQSTRRFEAELVRGSATLRLTPLGMKRLRGLGHALGEAAAASAQAEPGRPGWQRVSVPIETIEHATGQMLRLGPEAEVIAPPALRDSVATTVGRTAALYAAPVSDRTRRPARGRAAAPPPSPRRTRP